MLKTTRILFAAAFALLALPAAADTRPIVVELFTSQGCSSCPPADAVLAELTGRPDILALGFHVDYWDRLGWKDPLSAPGSTTRQKDYAAQFGGHEIYTPQIVVDGERQVVGSRRRLARRLEEGAGRLKHRADLAIATGYVPRGTGN